MSRIYVIEGDITNHPSELLWAGTSKTRGREIMEVLSDREFFLLTNIPNMHEFLGLDSYTMTEFVDGVPMEMISVHFERRVVIKSRKTRLGLVGREWHVVPTDAW